MEGMELELFPEKPGVYLMKNKKGEVLYVGKAKLLKTRIKQYYVPGRDKRVMVPLLIRQIAHIETLITFTEAEALLLENSLIKKYKPKYNVLLKDDKSFLALLVNIENRYPMVKLVRFREGREKEFQGRMFGPYASALLARNIYDLTARLFPLRQCTDRELVSRKRPCILYDMKRCIAPCTAKCTNEEYDTVVENLLEFLSGKNQRLIAAIKQEIREASDMLAFERAHALLETLKQVEEISNAKKGIYTPHKKDCDVFHLVREDGSCLVMKLLFRDGTLVSSESFPFSLLASTDEELFTSLLIQHYEKTPPAPEVILPITLTDAPILEEILKVKITVPQMGDKKTLLDLTLENARAIFTQEKDTRGPGNETLLYLEERLELNRFPTYIECIDTSHLAGSEMVASVVAFTEGVKDTSRYRLYKLRETKASDDYGALTEVLKRHLERAKTRDALPDLILLDGGKGHLSTAKRVLEELNITSIDIASFAKENGRHDKGISAERIFLPRMEEPISLDRHSPLLFFLQRIRDEAHRSAITFQKKRRSKEQYKSALDDVPGIGPKKKIALLRHFGSVEKIKAASLEKLSELSLLSKTDCKAIYDFFKKAAKAKR
ncbi:MAG: excinuclease ABC subunit UvrC [Verrucomicrobia bacterium]|nr:excinuclease ABC subunit UvrC [Verrucomicrobiota bacterium]